MSKNKQNTLFNQIQFKNYPSTIFILKWILIGSFIGVLIGSASAGFLASLHWATNFRENNLWIISLLPIGGFLIGLMYHYYGKNAEAGNNLLIDTIHQPKAKIPLIMAPFVYIGTIVTHILGGSAGREGTALQIAGSIADQFYKLFRLNPSERQILLISAVAGGFGSVFGTPLAGAVFALEFYLIGKINYKALFPAFFTAIFADLITKMWNIPHVHYHIQSIPDLSIPTILYAIIAGIIFGICAATFSKLMFWSGKLFKSTVKYPPLRPFVGGIIIVGLIWLLGTTKFIGLGIPTIVEAFTTQQPFYFFAIKIILTVITLSAGYKGGEVTPLFFIGATLGNALALFLPLEYSLLAGMGFVAVFAGATNTPIACIIMALELFGVECGIYVALACIVSYYVSGSTSIYRNQIIGTAKNEIFIEQEGKKLNDL